MVKKVKDSANPADGEEGGSNVPADVIELHSRIIQKLAAAKEAANDVYKTAKSEYSNAIKAAKAVGVNTAPLLRAIKAKNGDPDMADIELRDEIRYRKILGVPVKWAEDGQGGFDFEDTELSADAEKERDDFDYFEDGKKAGLDGHSLTTNPHKAGEEGHQLWVNGWQEGQTELATKGQKPAKAATPKRTKPTAPPVH